MIVGSIVLSKAGHDKGHIHMITAIEDGFVLIADGKHSKIESPKRKNIKHLEHISRFGDFNTEVTNKELRKIIATCREGGCV
jgi:ribosomal protein L14E/L6E/L27E